jgi:hypothetical protein
MDIGNTAPLASKEEMYFSWYIKELQEQNLIEKVTYQPKPFIVTEPLLARQVIQGPRKAKIRSVAILDSYEYQADFMFYWKQGSENILFKPLEEILSGTEQRYSQYPFIANKAKSGRFYSVIDVKGVFNQHDAHRRFARDQKVVYAKFGVYVQKIVTAPQVSSSGKCTPANALFPMTFTPARYLFCDDAPRPRKIRFRVRTIFDFIHH